MSLEVWLSFVTASAILVAIPGPANLFLITSTLQGGYRAGIPAVIGVSIGVFTSVLLALLGVSSAIAASEYLFLIIKFGGAAYLVFLGVNVWRTALQAPVPNKIGGQSRKSITTSAFLVSILNPKVLMFYVAFLPQFIDPERPVLIQAKILIATFVLLALINAGFWVVLAHVSSKLLLESHLFPLVNKSAALLLIAAGCSVFLIH